MTQINHNLRTEMEQQQQPCESRLSDDITKVDDAGEADNDGDDKDAVVATSRRGEGRGDRTRK